MTDMDPAAAADMATGGGAGAESAGAVEGEVTPLPGAEDSQRADTRESGTSLIDGLLETQPPGSVAEYPDMPDPAAHALIGAQKFVHGIAGDRDMSGGKPAVVDFIQAGVSFLSGDDDAPSDPETEPASDDDDRSHLVGQTGGDLDE